MDTRTLSKDELRLARKYLQEENRKWPAHLVSVPKEKWPAPTIPFQAVVIEVWRSKEFLVQIWNEKNGRKRISVNRSSLNGEGEYHDGITWDELMRLKRECGYGDHDAMEIYPRDRDIVNVANMRHLWIIHENDEIDFIWRSKK